MKINKMLDMHAHFRYGSMAKTVIPFHNKLCSAAIAMPNVPMIRSGLEASDYRKELNSNNKFRILSTIQITKDTTPEIIKEAKLHGVVACKIYPKGQTTGSEDGLEESLLFEPSSNLLDTFNEMQYQNMILEFHAELPSSFCLDKERDFLPIIKNIITKFPKLKCVLEHVSTDEGVSFVKDNPTVAATITPQHLIYTLDDIIGLPYNFCKPIYKLPKDRKALIDIICSGHSRFFAGSDSAPHGLLHKLQGCAGVFAPPHISIPIYASIFEQINCLHKLEAFTSIYGSQWYNIEEPKEKLILTKKKWIVPHQYTDIVPLLYNKQLDWEIYEDK